jgi:hypothetical protein
MVITRKAEEEDVAVAEGDEEEGAEGEEVDVEDDPPRVLEDGSLMRNGKRCQNTKRRRYEPNEVITLKGK